VDQIAPTVGDSSYSTLNEEETELLEFLHKAVAEENAYFAQQVRGIIQEVCVSGVADRKKVWGALSGEEQQKFSKLVAVEIPAEVGHIIESMHIILASDDSNEIDHLCRVFSRDCIATAAEFLKTDDVTKLWGWIKIQDLAAILLEASLYGLDVIYERAAASSHGDLEGAIARLEYLKEWNAVEKIRQALFTGETLGETPQATSELTQDGNLAQELADAFCEPSRLREIAAGCRAEAVERAIAEIEQDDEEMAEEIRDLLG
jgi:hypothetical protein